MDWIMRGRSKKENNAPANGTEQVPPSPPDGKTYMHEDYANEVLIDASMSALVALPEGVDTREWVATNTIPFFNNTALMCAALAEVCSPSTCQCARISPEQPFVWTDERGRKVKCSAPQYIDLVLSFVQRHVDDAALFPAQHTQAMGAQFDLTVRRVYRLLLHVISHLILSHYDAVVRLKLHTHLNTLFKHFVSFSLTYRLLEERDLEPLSELVALVT